MHAMNAAGRSSALTGLQKGGTSVSSVSEAA